RRLATPYRLTGVCCEVPSARRGHLVLETSQRLLNRLRLLVAGGRNPDLEGNVHGSAPAHGVMGQGQYLPHASSPSAEGTGRPCPTVVHHRPVRQPHGAPASVCSWVPPASSVHWTQKDPPALGSAAKPQWASPPREEQLTAAGAATFVICDDTIEVFIRDW